MSQLISLVLLQPNFIKDEMMLASIYEIELLFLLYCKLQIV